MVIIYAVSEFNNYQLACVQIDPAIYNVLSIVYSLFMIPNRNQESEANYE